MPTSPQVFKLARMLVSEQSATTSIDAVIKGLQVGNVLNSHCASSINTRYKLKLTH